MERPAMTKDARFDLQAQPIRADLAAQAPLAAVSLAGKGETDQFLAQVVALLQARGVRLAGTVQTNSLRPDRPRCDMDLRILPDGPVLRISEDRGALARGCRLHLGALEQAVVEIEARLDGAGLLVVNKFGKREAEGKGLVPVIALAIGRGIPVLVGVNGLNLAALRDFAGGLLGELPADVAAVVDWAMTHAARPEDGDDASPDASPDASHDANHDA
jgi:hypothetical protein